MNTNYILPPPTNWDMFENICCDLWKHIWADPKTHIHGRKGQSQNGIDIYGKPLFSYSYSGVQCKGKNRYYGNALKTTEVDSECEKARGFQPQLDTFIIATTSPRDKKIQEYCRTITQQKKYPFAVDTWAWEDIEEEIKFRPELVEKFYDNNCGDLALLPKISISLFSPVHKLRAFFTRPGILNKLNAVALQILDNLVQEMAINAFEHGNASYFKVEVHGSNIKCIDNGKEFDPLSLLENETGRVRGGGETLVDANELFSMNYKRQDTENVLVLDFFCQTEEFSDAGVYSICASVDDLYGRRHAHNKAFQELGKIPSDASKIIVDICGKYGLCRSASYGLIDAIQEMLAPQQKATILLPIGMYFSSCLIEKYSDDKRISFIEKDKL